MLTFMQNVQKRFEQFTSSLGISNNKELGIASDNINNIIFKELDYPADLATLFCYRRFDSENQLFYNNDNNIGFIIEIAPIVGVNELILKNLQHFLDDELPENSYLQFLLIASHKVGNIVDDWSKSRINPHPSLAKITESRAEFISRMALDFRQSTDRVARDIRIIVSCNWHGKAPSQILAFRQQFIKKLETLQLHPQLLDAQDLLDLTDEILHFRHDINQRGNRYNPLMLLCDQVATAGSTCALKEAQLEFTGNVITKCYRVAEFPESWGGIPN